MKDFSPATFIETYRWQCCGYGIRYFLTPGSGIWHGKKSDPGPGMNIPGNISESLKIFWGYKYWFLIWIWIQDPGSGMKKLGSGMLIPDPQNTDWWYKGSRLRNLERVQRWEAEEAGGHARTCEAGGRTCQVSLPTKKNDLPSLLPPPSYGRLENCGKVRRHRISNKLYMAGLHVLVSADGSMIVRGVWVTW